MSVMHRRLDRVAASLTPQQAVLAWLDEAQQHPTLPDYSASLMGQPDLAFPMHAIPHQVAEAAKKALKGQPREVIGRAVRHALLESTFLIHLVIDANTHVLQHRREHWLQVALVTESQRPAIRGWETWDAARVEKWNDQVTNLAHEVFRVFYAVELLAQHYLAGRTPLFSATGAELTQQKELVEQLIEFSNESLELGMLGPNSVKARRRLQLDLGKLNQLGRQGARSLAEYLVDMAKFEALRGMGEDEQAFALLERHV